MKPSLLIAGAAALACAGPFAHAGDAYGDALTVYKAELKREPPDLVNGAYYGDLATSQAKRAVQRNEANTTNLGPDATQDGSRSAPSRNGGVNVASPQIFGTVRGNVTVVVQRGAIRGSITSVGH